MDATTSRRRAAADPELTVASPPLRLLDAVPPAGGAVVMGTGIVSIGLALDQERALSLVLFGVAAALWLGLLAVLVRRALCQRARLLEEARLPDALTVVAGTAVLGNAAETPRLAELAPRKG